MSQIDEMISVIRTEGMRFNLLLTGLLDKLKDVDDSDEDEYDFPNNYRESRIKEQIKCIENVIETIIQKLQEWE